MAEDFSLRLEEQLCFNLYAATNAITHRYKRYLDKIDLTFPQYLVLLALREKPHLTSGELAQALRLDAGSLSPILKRLAAAGLIERVRQNGDNRVIYSELTPAGLALGDDMIKAQASVRCGIDLADDDLATLRGTLKGLTETLMAS